MKKLQHPVIGYLALIAVLAVWSVMQQQDVYDTQVAGCERANDGLRQPLYDFFSGAIAARGAEAVSEDAETRRTAQKAVKDYTEAQQMMVDAAAPYAATPGSPLVDCPNAFAEPGVPW